MHYHPRKSKIKYQAFKDAFSFKIKKIIKTQNFMYFNLHSSKIEFHAFIYPFFKNNKAKKKFKFHAFIYAFFKNDKKNKIKVSCFLQR